MTKLWSWSISACMSNLNERRTLASCAMLVADELNRNGRFDSVAEGDANSCCIVFLNQ